MAKKTIYRAIRVDGIVHGGGGSRNGAWRRSWKQANRDLDELIAAYDDSFGCVEAYQLEETQAQNILFKQGR